MVNAKRGVWRQDGGILVSGKIKKCVGWVECHPHPTTPTQSAAPNEMPRRDRTSKMAWGIRGAIIWLCSHEWFIKQTHVTQGFVANQSHLFLPFPKDWEQSWKKKIRKQGWEKEKRTEELHENMRKLFCFLGMCSCVVVRHCESGDVHLLTKKENMGWVITKGTHAIPV